MEEEEDEKEEQQQQEEDLVPLELFVAQSEPIVVIPVTTIREKYLHLYNF